MSIPTQTLLRRLRRQLTAAFALLACLGFAILAYGLLRADTEFQSRNVASELRGQAARATVLAYSGSAQPAIDDLRGDMVTRWAYGLALFSVGPNGRLVPVFTSGVVEPATVEPVARGALLDLDEKGTSGQAQTSTEEVEVVAMPWFDAKGIIRGAVVTLAPSPRVRASRLLLPVSIGLAVLCGLLTLTVWFLAGRSLRPAGAALEDRERFLATAAHELRAPLARLRAGAEAARRAAPVTDPSAQALRRLVTVADSAGRVVANLLLASRIDHAEVPIRMDRVRLDQLVCDAENLLEEIIVDIREPVTIRGDAGLLQHALINLVDNAVRHGRVGEDAPTVTVSVFHRAGMAVLRVSDDGPGFPSGVDVLSRYVSGARGGTGLGLPLVEWIAKRHDATLDLGVGGSTEPGARVELAFPVAGAFRDESGPNV